MIWKLIVSAIALVLVTAGTASAEWIKWYGGNEFDGKNVVNGVSAKSKRWKLRITKWEDGTVQSKLVKYPRQNDYSHYVKRGCTPDFEVLVDGKRKDSSFTVARTAFDPKFQSSIYYFANSKSVMKLADKHNKIVLRDKKYCIDGIIRFNTQGSLDLSW